jgi:hypothetical protein
MVIGDKSRDGRNRKRPTLNVQRPKSKAEDSEQGDGKCGLGIADLGLLSADEFLERNRDLRKIAKNLAIHREQRNSLFFGQRDEFAIVGRTA